MKPLFAASLAAMIGLAACGANGQLAASAAPRPDALISSVTEEVIAVLKRDAAAGQPTDVARLVETKILPLFDFQRMTRIALARNWYAASARQQEALVTQFTTLLVHTYSAALSGYRGEYIEYKPLRFASGETDVLVRSTVMRGSAEVLTIDYDMERTPAGWKVYDVKLAGVSLVATYRESFATAVRSGGVDGLVKQLADRNRQNNSRSKAPAPG